MKRSDGFSEATLNLFQGSDVIKCVWRPNLRSVFKNGANVSAEGKLKIRWIFRKKAARDKSRLSESFFNSEINMKREEEFIIHDNTKIRTVCDLRKFIRINEVRSWNRKFGIRNRKNRAFWNRNRKLLRFKFIIFVSNALCF